MRKVLFGVWVLAGLLACKKEEHTATRVVTQPGREKITIAARSLDDTSIRWATRAADEEVGRLRDLSEVRFVPP